MRWALIAVLVAGWCCSAAHADQQWFRTDVVCSKTQDVALLRFTETSDDGPDDYVRLAKSIDGGLSADKGTKRTDCTTRWGAAIRLRDGAGQAMPYGQGGGDPPGFFSLWIDKHKIFSRKEWKPGYGADSDKDARRIVGIAIHPDRLTICTNSYYWENDGKDIACHDEPLNLASHPVDAIEYPDKPVAQRPVGTLYANAKSPRLELCRQRLVAAHELYRLEELDAVKRIKVGNDEDRLLSRVEGSYPNVGAQQVFIYGDTSHYFDGDVVVMVPASVTAKDVAAWFKKVDLESGLQTSLPSGWHLYAGGRERLYPKVSPRYVHFTPQKIDGQLYFLARPTNDEVEPAAALVLPRADGGFEISCAYHVSKAHY